MRAQQKIWIVIRENGEKHTMHKEPIEGWEEWTKGQEIAVFEYSLSKTIYYKPPTPKKSKAPDKKPK